MKEVFIVKPDKKEKAEEMLKKDEEINRGSIVLKSASSLGVNEDGYFIILDAPEHAVARAKKILSGIAEVYKDKHDVLRAYEEQENAAMEGFGKLLGD
ncbi:MAG: hypothetical protein HYW27_04180 [Candidatus Aenigmarchaeota archaeon]|nr:hypothetical protein [Candidatus Aenigmarchaeota archaeon]